MSPESARVSELLPVSPDGFNKTVLVATDKQASELGRKAEPQPASTRKRTRRQGPAGTHTSLQSRFQSGAYWWAAQGGNSYPNLSQSYLLWASYFPCQAGAQALVQKHRSVRPPHASQCVSALSRAVVCRTLKCTPCDPIGKWVCWPTQHCQEG